MARRGLRVCDLLDAEGLADKIHVQLAEKHRILATLGDTSSIDPESLCRSYVECGKRIRPIAVDTTILINQWIQEGRTLLFEGAQGTLLDIDHGTFPYVTSSSTAAGGVATGLGISPKHIDTVLGVTKAYATRVGLGPFPTEAGDQAGDQLRSAGNEFGATTGRARRCGVV